MSVAGAASVEVAGVVAARRATAAGNWGESRQQWAREALAAGHDDLLGTAMPLFERTMIDVALQATRGQRQEAARRLGWGRNTLTRKIKELGIADDDSSEERRLGNESVSPCRSRVSPAH